MTENKPFWMVVREGESANAPTKKHFTDEEAYTEAARLLKKDPHRRFWVMQAIGGVYNTMQMTTVEFKTKEPSYVAGTTYECQPDTIIGDLLAPEGETQGPDKFGRYTAEEANQNIRENMAALNDPDA